MAEFQKKLRGLLDAGNMDEEVGCPDFVLANYLKLCLLAFNGAVRQRDKWYGHSVEHSNPPEKVDGCLPPGKLDKYKAGGGHDCPFCGSYRLIRSAIEPFENTLQQSVGCYVCGAEWVDAYTLNRVSVETQPFQAEGQS